MINGSPFLSDAVVHALGWTLIHSLWQGAAAASILWLLLPRLRQARQRYLAGFAALLSVLLAALVSFAYLYEPAAPSVEPAAATGLPVAAGLSTTLALPEPAFWQLAAEALEAWHPIIVSIWLLGFGFFLLRLAGGLHYLRGLRRHSQPMPEPWQQRLDALARRLGQSRPVLLLESALIQTPMALGFFKPLVLFPLGWVNQLQPAEVEAILAHELAHIVRRDWVFNLLQTLIDALFYFHPAVWWISAQVRAERENCCDDTAVRLTGNRLVYAKTLVRLQDLAQTTKHPALALGLDGAKPLLGRRPLLLERIKRILQQPQQASSLMEKTIAVAILLALITLLSVRAGSSPVLAAAIREAVAQPAAWLSADPQPSETYQAPADSLKPERSRKIISDDGQQRVEMELKNGKLSRLNVDGKEIPENEFDQYQTLTTQVLEEASTPPAPPAPPAPPSGWGTSFPAAPMAPMPPMAIGGRRAQITTDKDDNGNTIIHLDQGGKPMEIKVKDGVVWIDGAEVEVGETLELPGGNGIFFQGDEGQGFRFETQPFRFEYPNASSPGFPAPAQAPRVFELDGNRIHFEDLNGQHFEFKYPKFSAEDLEGLQGDALQHLEEQQQRLNDELKALKQARKDVSKAQKAERKALDEARRNMDGAREQYREALQKARVEQLRATELARADQRNQVYLLREQRNAESTGGFLKNAMIAEKLITDPNNFSFELSGKALSINGKKQAPELHKKYLDLYREKTGKELSNKDSIRVEEEN